MTIPCLVNFGGPPPKKKKEKEKKGGCTARKLTFKDLKDLEREPLRHCEGDGKVTFRDWSLITGRGGLQNGRGGHVKFKPYEKGGRKKF